MACVFLGVITARSTSEVLDAMRPFVYLVIDRVTNVALLAGKVEDPTTDRIFWPNTFNPAPQFAKPSGVAP